MIYDVIFFRGPTSRVAGSRGAGPMKAISSKALALACLLCAGLWVQTTQAATLIVDPDGTLIGATGVIVEGRPYSVTFADGSCETAFDGCNPAAFAFDTVGSATAAALALLDQVFIDGPAGNFDTGFDILGCSTAFDGCFTRIPYALQGSGTYLMVTAINGLGTDFVVPEGPFTIDNGPFPNLNFGIFAPVPVPAGLPLLLGALAGLWQLRRLRGRRAEVP